MSAFTRAGENGRLIAGGTGQGANGGADAAAAARTPGSRSRRPSARCVVPCANAPVDLLLVRPSDIPEYVQDGVVDLGITGANLVVEAQADVSRRSPSSASRAAR